MNSPLELEQRKALHGADYVAMYQLKSPARLRRLVDRMQLASSYRILDFGCGDGVIAEYVSKKVESYIGVDFSEDFISVANNKKKALNLGNAEFVCSDIIKFSEKNLSSFDVGFAFDLSEHVYDNEWQDIVSAMYRCLRPGGVFYLHTPNAEFILEKMKKENFILKQFPAHIAVRNQKENAHFFEEAGFTDVDAQFIPHYNVLKYIHPLSHLPGIGKYFQARLFISARKPAV